MFSDSEILKLFEKWNKALLSKNPDEVVNLYSKNAILLPTLSNKIRHNHTEIRDYFVQFLSLNPIGEIKEYNIRCFEDIIINSGIYFFEVDKESHREKVGARFTFVYKKINNNWLIIEHHSSLLPE